MTDYELIRIVEHMINCDNTACKTCGMAKDKKGNRYCISFHEDVLPELLKRFKNLKGGC